MLGHLVKCANEQVLRTHNILECTDAENRQVVGLLEMISKIKPGSEANTSRRVVNSVSTLKSYSVVQYFGLAYGLRQCSGVPTNTPIPIPPIESNYILPEVQKRPQRYILHGWRSDQGRISGEIRGHRIPVGVDGLLGGGNDSGVAGGSRLDHLADGCEFTVCVRGWWARRPTAKRQEGREGGKEGRRWGSSQG